MGNRKINNSYMKKDKKSSKDFQITSHAMYRAEERLKITSKSELKKLCHDAKYKGINITLIRRETYPLYGLTWEQYCYIKGRFAKTNNSTYLYYYRNCIFIFVGKGGRTLKTVINCTN